MSFFRLSPAAQALLQEIVMASSAPIGRTDRLIAAIEQMAACQEPAFIPALVSFLLDEDTSIVCSAETAIATLYAALPASHLPALDEAMRSYGGYLYPVKWMLRWQNIPPEQVNTLIRADPQSCVLLLGLACCHASGYVRRNAVACLDQQVRTGTELPFLLLRLNDWVAPVRLRAEAAVRQRLDAVHRQGRRRHVATRVRRAVAWR